MRAHILIFFATSVAIVMSCGKTASDNDGGPSNPDCPASAPAQGSACNKDGLSCEYGNDFNPLCNTIVVCSGAKWASPVYYGGTRDCPSGPLPTSKPNPADCAATRGGVPVGTACSSMSTCAYDGSTCFCGAFCPSYPVGMPMCNADAGVTMNCCDKSKITWHCFDGPNYCAMPRPRIGSPCTMQGQECAAGPPVECGQTVIECDKGVWTVLDNSCPISTRRMKKNIAYLAPSDAERTRDELLSVRLATYRYKSGDDATHLGFIIEDMPEQSPAVMPSRERVDLYGYTSMAVATIQLQQAEIAALEKRLADVEARCAKAER